MPKDTSKQPAVSIDANEVITVPMLVEATGCTSESTKAKVLEKMGCDVVAVAKGANFICGRQIMLSIEKLADESGLEAARKRLGL